jgi:hypothetical protein
MVETSTTQAQPRCAVCNMPLGHCRPRWREDSLPHRQRDSRVPTCSKPTLGPDDLVKPCVLVKDHEGFCSTGR